MTKKQEFEEKFPIRQMGGKSWTLKGVKYMILPLDEGWNWIQKKDKQQNEDIIKMIKETKQKITEIDAPYQGEEYRKGFNDTKVKAFIILQTLINKIKK